MTNGWAKVREAELTLLAYAITDDKVVIGADGSLLSTAEAPGGLCPFSVTPGHKIRQIPGHPLFWGVCGSLGDYGDFDRWTRTEADLTGDWDHFADQAQQQVAKMNRSSDEEGLPPVAVLVVGRILGKMNVLVMEKGYRAFHPCMGDVKDGFVGVYGPTANTAWRVLHSHNESLSLADEPTMRRFMESLHDPIPMLGAPFHTESVTKSHPADTP